jgi:hypothetical protein
MYKDFNARLTKLQERAGLSNPRYMLKKLIKDIDNLERYYTDREYRNKLQSAQEEKVKEKLNLPQNCTIRYEKVRCCKDCRHNTHRYYYGYIWDCNSKKLKKKYIGKQLPLPITNII